MGAARTVKYRKSLIDHVICVLFINIAGTIDCRQFRTDLEADGVKVKHSQNNKYFLMLN